MKDYTRKDDEMIDEIRADVKDILKILNGNGKIGLVGQTINNTIAIEELKKKPNNIRAGLVSVAQILVAIVAVVALYKGIK